MADALVVYRLRLAMCELRVVLLVLLVWTTRRKARGGEQEACFLFSTEAGVEYTSELS